MMISRYQNAPRTLRNAAIALLRGAGLATLIWACSSSHGGGSAVGQNKRVASDSGLRRVNHIVVIYMENHSFDNLYGEFPGADGLANASATSTQVDESGHPFATLPPPPGDARFNHPLPNGPFNIDEVVPANMRIPDLIHRYYQEQLQIDGGKMDRFALISDSRGLSMGYYHTALLPLAAEASNYTLMDHFFHGAFGGSFMNHIWLISTRPLEFPSAPDAMKARLDDVGKLVRDGQVTPDGYVVNTSYTLNTPHPAKADTKSLVPNQTFPTIGDRLNDAGVTWAWYSGGWNDAVAGHPDPSFQYHHQPFAYFQNYADGTQLRRDHLKDESEFLQAAAAGTLPAVSFVKPLGEENEHPGYSDVVTGEQHAVKLIDAVRNGPDWNDCVIILTYDENGGFWDHVAPPVVDKWGPGSRVATIIVSPFARRHFIDHTRYETSSILAFIERRFGLPPLTDRDRNAGDLMTAFEF